MYFALTLAVAVYANHCPGNFVSKRNIHMILNLFSLIEPYTVFRSNLTYQRVIKKLGGGVLSVILLCEFKKYI